MIVNGVWCDALAGIPGTTARKCAAIGSARLLSESTALHPDNATFGKLLGAMTIGPALGIVVFFIIIAQQTNIAGWCWAQFGCCLLAAAWSWRHTAVVGSEGMAEFGNNDQEPLLSTPKNI